MKFLVILTPASGRSRADFEPLFVPEERAVWAAYKAGRLREMYFQPEPTVVSLIFEAADQAAVETELASLPMIDAKLLDVRIVMLGPWVPLEALFDQSLMQMGR